VRRGVNVGDQVRVERDETRYPSKGTWPRFRGRTGTVVEINRDRKRPHLIEYGVVFGKVRNPNENGSIAMGAKTTWFKLYELRPVVGVAAESPAGAPNMAPAIEGPQAADNRCCAETRQRTPCGGRAAPRARLADLVEVLTDPEVAYYARLPMSGPGTS